MGHTIVRVDHEQHFLEIKWFPVQVPRNGGTLAIGTAAPFDSPSRLSGVDRAVCAPIGDHHDLEHVHRVGLGVEVRDEVSDHSGLIVRGDHNPDPARFARGCRSAILPSPESNDRVVAGEGGDQRLWDGCEKPYHDNPQRTAYPYQAGLSVTVLPDRSIAVVLGTRPEIVKLAGLVRLLGPAARVIYTGQHYDPQLSGVFFDEFGMTRPDVHVGIGAERRGTQIGRATEGLDGLFAEDRPLAVVVQGDTNTVAAGALAANASEIPLVHVESGLRSFDRRMPEEHNRVIADHLADRCLAATETNRGNLLAERIDDDRIVVTGNTIVEAVERLMPPEEERTAVINRYGVRSGGFVLSTFHRPENVDDPESLRSILTGLASLPIPVLIPLHPRTVRRIEEFDLGGSLDGLTVVESIGYRDFLALGAESAFLVSDSGGVQEEVSVYKRPLVVVRRSTERPEVLGTFVELVEPGPAISAIASDWLSRLPELHHDLAAIPSPFGDASAPRRSLDVITDLVNG